MSGRPKRDFLRGRSRASSPAARRHKNLRRVVTYTATDAAGNSAQVTMEITVIDVEAPVLFAPPDMEVFVDVGESFATVTLPNVEATDNVDGIFFAIPDAVSPAQFETGDNLGVTSRRPTCPITRRPRP